VSLKSRGTVRFTLKSFVALLSIGAAVRVPVGRKERKEKEKKGENGLSTTYVH
jgi:hypothetical protein